MTLLHRDGLELGLWWRMETELAYKFDRRGRLSTRGVLVSSDCRDPEGRDWRPADQHVVLAFPLDIHHAVMTPEQAIALGNELRRHGRQLLELRKQRQPATGAIEAPLLKRIRTTEDRLDKLEGGA